MFYYTSSSIIFSSQGCGSSADFRFDHWPKNNKVFVMLHRFSSLFFPSSTTHIPWVFQSVQFGHWVLTSDFDIKSWASQWKKPILMISLGVRIKLVSLPCSTQASSLPAFSEQLTQFPALWLAIWTNHSCFQNIYPGIYHSSSCEHIIFNCWLVLMHKW